MKKKICLSLVLVSMLNAQDTQNVMLEDITVTATKIEDKISKVPLSISVIDEKKFLKEGTTSLYDTLANEVGVSVSGWGEGRAQNITIRGIGGNRIKIIKDGVPISDGYGANNLNDTLGANSFDLSTLKNIEILKGANSSLQGSGSLAGAIVVNTKKLYDYLAEDDSYFSSTTKYSGQSEKYQQNLIYAKKIGNLQLGVEGTYSDSKQTENFEENLLKRDIDASKYALLQAYGFDNLYWSNKIEIYHEDALRSEGKVPTQGDGRKWTVQDFKKQKDTKNNEFTSDFEFSTNNNLIQDVEAKVYYRDTKLEEDRNALIRSEDNGTILKRIQKDDNLYQNKIYGSKVEVGNEFENHTLKYGLNVQNSLHKRTKEKTVIDSTGVKVDNSQPFSEAETLEAGLFITDKYNLDKLTVNLSLRYDYKKLEAKKSSFNSGDVKISNNIAPSLGLSYALTNDLNVYSSYNRGFKAPGADKVYANVPHIDSGPLGGFIIVPNLELKKEFSDSVEIGTKYKSNDTYFHLALFKTWYKDFIDTKNIGRNSNGINQIQYVNKDKVRIHGFETSIEHKINNSLSISSRLGWLDGKDEEGKRLRDLSPLEGNTSVNYTYKKLELVSRLNYAAAMNKVPTCVYERNNTNVEDSCTKTAGWATLDTGITYNHKKNITFSLYGFNLLNKRHENYQDVRGSLEGSTDFYARVGRYFNASLRMEF